MTNRVVLLLFAITILISACGTYAGDKKDAAEVLIRGREYDATGMNSVDIPDIGLHAELRDVMLEEAELVILNNSPKSYAYYSYSQEFTIYELRPSTEKEAGYDIVCELPYSMLFWESVLYNVQPGTDGHQSLQWSSSYGSLDPSGVYLLEKELRCDNKTYRIGIVFTPAMGATSPDEADTLPQ